MHSQNPWIISWCFFRILGSIDDINATFLILLSWFLVVTTDCISPSIFSMGWSFKSLILLLEWLNSLLVSIDPWFWVIKSYSSFVSTKFLGFSSNETCIVSSMVSVLKLNTLYALLLLEYPIKIPLSDLWSNLSKLSFVFKIKHLLPKILK